MTNVVRACDAKDSKTSSALREEPILSPTSPQLMTFSADQPLRSKTFERPSRHGHTYSNRGEKRQVKKVSPSEFVAPSHEVRA